MSERDLTLGDILFNTKLSTLWTIGLVVVAIFGGGTWTGRQSVATTSKVSADCPVFESNASSTSNPILAAIEANPKAPQPAKADASFRPLTADESNRPIHELPVGTFGWIGRGDLQDYIRNPQSNYSNVVNYYYDDILIIRDKARRLKIAVFVDDDLSAAIQDRKTNGDFLAYLKDVGARKQTYIFVDDIKQVDGGLVDIDGLPFPTLRLTLK